ncbi:MAG: SEL1-like repeat protein [gamma proteobacterium symbiont of Taylorina sp.]|nr:SEL1-like repeat protein [gamma proteobacterium symbiont of Taylorina sp.]
MIDRNCRIYLLLLLFPCALFANDELLSNDFKSIDPTELYELAMVYENGGQWHGRNINKDPLKSLNYITTSAQKGYFKAQYKLAMIYSHAESVNKNYAITRIYLTRSAEQHYPQAQYMMGVMYAQGRVFKKNEKLAIEWLTKASDNDNAAAQHYLARYYLNQKNFELAFFWLEKAIKQNYQPAMVDMGYLYYNGNGIKKDFSKAIELLQAAAEKKIMLAQYLMGKIYYSGGYGIDKDLSKAKKWFQEAVKSGSFDAKKYLMSIAVLKNKLVSQSKINSENEEVVAEKYETTGDKNEPIAEKPEVMPEKNKAMVKKIKKVPSVNSLPLDNNSFEKFNDDDYVIQIIQAKIPASIQKFIEQREHQALSICQIKQNNQTFYVVTYGHFSGYSDAKKALNELSERQLFINLDLWIRSASQIKSLLVF